MILSPVTSRKAKEHDDGNASEEVVIARCPLVFTGGHRGGVATGLLGWLVIDAYFALTGRSGDGVLDALCQRRIVAASGDQLLAGVGLVRGGAGTALVGDGPTVAARINEYAALGIDSFVLSGYPHLEEAYRVGELLFPLLDVAIPEIPQPQPLNPQGEAVANDFIPRKVAQS